MDARSEAPEQEGDAVTPERKDGYAPIESYGLAVLRIRRRETTSGRAARPFIHAWGRPLSAADSKPLLELPGFVLLNYGRSTPLVTILAHVV